MMKSPSGIIRSDENDKINIMVAVNQVKIAVAQLEIIAGRPDLNVGKILGAIETAKNNGDHIIVFTEMAVPGYLLGDEWDNAAFVNDCFNYNEDIRRASGDVIVIWGNIDVDPTKRNEDGRIRKYNAAFVAHKGEYLLHTPVHKTLMPKYREFDDERHFYAARKTAQDKNMPLESLFQPVNVILAGEQHKIGLILCEDMWSDDYTINPIEYLLQKKTDIIINISASPWTWRKNNKRHSVVRQRIKDHPGYFVYANNIGIQNNGKNIFLFDGNSTIYNPDGTLLKVAQDYTEEILRATLFKAGQSPVFIKDPDNESDIKELYAGLIYGIRNFFKRLPSQKVVIGVSGGIDSALSIALLAEALGPENIYAVNMPSRFNSETTKDAARKLAENLGLHYAVIPIQHSYESTISELQETVFTRLDGSAQSTPVILSAINCENIQARDRGSRVLAGVASALGAVFINNGNKTETALGYATLYGDVNGALAPLADLYKSEVYDLARYINRNSIIIPETIFNIPASAELSIEQNVDEGKGDPIFYPFHDKLVRAFTEFRLDPEDILRMYVNGSLCETLRCRQSVLDTCFSGDVQLFINDLEHKWKLFKTNVFKRIQAPPIIAVSKRAFGFDLREAQNGFYFTRDYMKLKSQLLNNTEKRHKV